MKIPTSIYKQFATKVYSCKADTLHREQVIRKRNLITSLKNQRDELVEGNSNDIHPAWKKEKRIQKVAENIIYYLITPKKQKARNFEVVIKEAFQL